MKYHSQFLLDKEKAKPTAKVRYRIKWQKYIVAFSLGFRVEIKKWNLETQRCKANTTHGKKKVAANIINRKIQTYENICERVFTEFEVDDKNPNADEFRNKFNSKIEELYQRKKRKKDEKGFFNIFDKFVEEESRINQWTESTLAKMRTVKKHLRNFDKDLILESLTEEKLYNYVFYLQEELNFKNSTILKNLSFLKWFLKWAVKKRYKVNKDFESFKLKLKTTQKKIIFLTSAELNQIKKFSIPEEKRYLMRVRDIFLFQCFTGLRYSDVANLKKSDIKENYIEVTTVKTTDSLIIELNDHSKELIQKYINNDYGNDKVFPVISNQRMNEYLKELAELAEIDEPIRETFYRGNERIDIVTPKYALLSTHAGRRTFICNALSLGIPPQVVMKWTGHSDYKTMKPYIDIADETKISAMERFNNI